jgi:hypothetical protein
LKSLDVQEKSLAKAADDGPGVVCDGSMPPAPWPPQPWHTAYDLMMAEATPPLIFSNLYNPPVQAPSPLTRTFHYINAGDPAQDYLVSERLQETETTEFARFNTILFSGSSLTKMEYDVAAHSVPFHIVLKDYDQYGWARTIDNKILPNLRASEAPPTFPIYFQAIDSMIQWSKPHRQRLPGSQCKNQIRGYDVQDNLDEILAHAVLTSPLTWTDLIHVPPYGGFPEQAKFNWVMDSVPSNYADSMPQWTITTGNIIGALARPNFTIMEPFQMNVGINFNPSISHIVDIDFTFPIKITEDGFFYLKWAPVTHGKGESWANIRACVGICF